MYERTRAMILRSYSYNDKGALLQSYLGIYYLVADVRLVIAAAAAATEKKDAIASFTVLAYMSSLLTYNHTRSWTP